jgi:methionyl-tRNA synthetase
MSKKVLVTTPIYYPNDKLHIGHAYTTSLADAIARFQKLIGNEVYFITGSDEHGQKIEDKAKEMGEDPYTYVSKIVESFKGL